MDLDETSDIIVFHFYALPHGSGRVLWSHLDVRVFVRPSQRFGLEVQFWNHIMLYSVKIHYKPFG